MLEAEDLTEGKGKKPMKRLSLRLGNAARWTTIAVAAAVLLAVPVFAQIQFSDVPDDNPHREDINAVAGQRWFVGYRDGTYKPDQKISPSEMTRVLTRAFDEGLTRAEFASFMVAGNIWQERVKRPLPVKWNTYDFGSASHHVPRGGRLYIVGYLNEPGNWWESDGYHHIEPGKYLIYHWNEALNNCRWMRLGYIPEGGQNFDTIAATDAPLAGYFQNEWTREPTTIRIDPTDTAFMIQCYNP